MTNPCGDRNISNYAREPRGKPKPPLDHTSESDGRRSVYGRGARMEEDDDDFLLLALRREHGAPREDIAKELRNHGAERIIT